MKITFNIGTLEEQKKFDEKRNYHYTNTGNPIDFPEAPEALEKTEVKMEVKKVIRDGMVAVLYSPGFGAGWSTWASHDLAEVCLYDPIVVAWVEGGKQGPVPVAHYGDEYFYSGGAEDLVVAWLPVGTAFIVNEYDGSESLRLKEDDYWNVA